MAPDILYTEDDLPVENPVLLWQCVNSMVKKATRAWM